MKNQKGNALVALISLLIFAAAAFGYVWNIVKLVHMNFDHITGMMIVRIIGIITGIIGAVVGYF